MKASEVLDNLKRRFPNEPEYHQAVSEVLGTIEEAYNEHPEFEKSNLIERLCIPDRIFSFRVTWMDDKGQIQTNMGYRIQHNNAIGPYKGGIRFHASVNQSILKFLAFEQTFKNSLTTLPMGGGKGGSDFSPRGKSNAEIMRFCQAFILELWHHIGPDTDVPAGDIGVGGREVAYMYGMYKKLARENTGTFTGKGIEFGGSLIRPEATGYGNVYFLLQMLKTRNIDIKDNVVGYIHSSEMFRAPKDWHDNVKQVPIVPETMSAHKLMKLFMQQKKTIAVVVDEFGGTSGIVSLEDLVEEIFGDIEDEHDNTSYICKQIDEHEYVLAARLEIEKVNETFGLDLPESDDYLTVGGLILSQYQSFPKLHEVIQIGRYQFKIIKVTATKIELVRLKVLE